ncbi:MAG: hypothetical protein LAT84_01015 [Balneolia bacterium]|nr:hypothetical protein [Balneolia bacterium]
MKTKLLTAALLSVFIIAPGLFADANAQDRNERKFSISLHGGVVLAQDSFRASPAGGFGVVAETNPVFGGALQYALSPYWSLELMGQYQSFENESGAALEFESTVIEVSLRNIIHLNQLLGTNRISNYIAPYAVLGGGVQIYDYSSNVFSSDDGVSGVAVAGLGLNIYLSRTVDLFAQYDFHMSSNVVNARVNNSSGGSAFTTYGTAIGGLRFNFGASDARHSSWRRAPIDLYQDDYDRLMGLNDRMDELERQVATQSDEIARLESEIDSRAGALEGRADQTESRVSDLERQFAEMQQSIRDREREPETRTEVDEAGLTQNLADGHYVQIYAGLTMSSAQSARRTMVEALEGVVDNPSEMVLITQRRQFYEVRVGVFNRFPDTVDVLRTAQNNFSDAFVVTFPRPAHLSDAYRDLSN